MNCPICSSGKTNEFICTEDFFLTGEKFELHKCAECGLISTANPPKEGESGRYYESPEYISHNDQSKGLISFAYMLVRDFMLFRKMRMIKSVSGLKTGSVLDIGSGTGHFLSVMRSAGWEVKGIEINQKARDYSKRALNLDVISPSEMESIPSATFDCVTLWHVLEHFYDPLSYMEEVNRVLKPGGLCVIALPNSDSYDAQHYGKYWAAYDVPRHLWHFTPTTFGLFAKKLGLNILSVKKLPFDVFYISILSEKYKKGGAPLFFGLLLGKWYWIKCLFNKNRCSSLVYFLG